jgi:hypothetical protein
MLRQPFRVAASPSPSLPLALLADMASGGQDLGAFQPPYKEGDNIADGIAKHCKFVVRSGPINRILLPWSETREIAKFPGSVGQGRHM